METLIEIDVDDGIVIGDDGGTGVIDDSENGDFPTEEGYGESFDEQVARQMASIQKAFLSLLLGEKLVDMYDFAYAAMENKAFSDDDLRKMVSSGLLSSDDYEKIKASFNTSEG